MRWTLPLFAVALLVPAAAQAGGPRALVVRDGLTAEQLAADAKVCLKEAKAAEKGRPIAPMPGGNSTAERLAGSAVAGALKGLSDMERFVAAHDACLERLGYRQVELSKEERQAYGRLKKPEQRTAYIVDFSRRVIAEGR